MHHFSTSQKEEQDVLEVLAITGCVRSGGYACVRVRLALAERVLEGYLQRAWLPRALLG